MTRDLAPAAPRRVFILMSSHALPYARHAIRTLLARSDEPVDMALVLDDAEEVARVDAALADLPRGQNRLRLVDKAEVSDRMADRLPRHAGIRALHEGHPCWRKITDPLVLSAPEDEVIVADPDLLFPNRFRFEKTLDTGVMMMRQGPTCLFPPEAVRAAMALGLPLADHVDIGVLQLRAGAVDLDWLDWVCRGLDLAAYRPFMHIEAIVWSALAMRLGGRHLDPAVWRCWERGHVKRLAVALGVPGVWTLKREKLDRLKCIHVSGPSKWWVTEALETGALTEPDNAILDPSQGPAYATLTPAAFERQQRLKAWAARAGYYRLTRSG